MGIAKHPADISYRGFPALYPTNYLADKAASHRLILIGTHHKNPQVHNIIIDALPLLAHDSGINTIFMEIPSDQQHAIDLFARGMAPVESIGMWDIIASGTYYDILLKARDLGLKIVAIDKPKALYTSRDRWMGNKVCRHLDADPDAKGIIIVGARHVFKDIKWINLDDPSLADYLHGRDIFSVIMWPKAIETTLPIAIDISPSIFKGVKDPILTAMNTMPNVSLATTADGVILMP